MKLPAALALLASVAFAATPSIGVIAAHGQFLVQGSRVWGNSTLFDGGTVQTMDASSEVALVGGVKVQLASASEARVWKNAMDLHRGTGQVRSSEMYPVRAGGFTVQGTRYRVAVSDSSIKVAALSGDARLIDARGALIAAVPAGQSRRFAMQQTVTVSGCLVYRAPGFLLQAEETGEVLQLTGGPLAQNVGNRVQVTGSPAATAATISPARSVLNVSALARRATGGCLTTAAALDAQTSIPANAPAPAAAPSIPPPGTTPAVTRAGMSTGAKIAIVGAVAGGGAGAALALGGKKSSTSP